MKLNYFALLVVWALMAASVLALVVWRSAVARGEDDTLHVREGDPVVSHQAEVAHKLDAIDRWGKALTVAMVVYGLAIAAAYVYQSWVATSTTIQGA